jgi:hypothetical protein
MEALYKKYEKLSKLEHIFQWATVTLSREYYFFRAYRFIFMYPTLNYHRDHILE